MINKNGSPLMPCGPAKARHLLDAGKAEVENLFPFTVRLEAHHIVSRSRGGKDTVRNLTTLCEPCHQKAHDGKITITGGVSGFGDRIAQRTMHICMRNSAGSPLSGRFSVIRPRLAGSPGTCRKSMTRMPCVRRL